MAKRKPDGPLSVAERNAVVEAFLAAYPRPSLLLGKRYSGMVRRAVYHRCDRDDIRSACLLGLVKAARLYSPERGEVAELSRRLDHDHQERGGRPVEGDVIDPPDAFLGTAWEAELREVLDSVPGGFLLAQRFGVEGVAKRTVEEIARQNGVTKDTVWARTARTMECIRDIYWR